MPASVRQIIESYNSELALEQAATPPASWYTDPRIADLEQRTVFKPWNARVGPAQTY